MEEFQRLEMIKKMYCKKSLYQILTLQLPILLYRM